MPIYEVTMDDKAGSTARVQFYARDLEEATENAKLYAPQIDEAFLVGRVLEVVAGAPESP